MDFSLVFQTIGTIASISSIPVAVIIFQKQRKSVFEDTRREILKKLSYIVADDNEITSVEVLSVIKSTLRFNNINENKVLATEIIEDMIAEVISNPLLDGERKVKINENLKSVMTEFLIITNITSMKSEDKKEYLSNYIKENTINKSEDNILNKINNEKVLNVELNRKNKMKDSIMTITSIIVSVLSSLFAGYALIIDQEKVSDIVSLNVNWLILIVSCFAVFSIIYVLIPKKKRT